MARDVNHMEPSMIQNAWVVKEESTAGDVVVCVHGHLGGRKRRVFWNIENQPGVTPDTMEATVDLMHCTDNPLGDIRPMVDTVKEVASRYTDIYGTWATNSEEEMVRILLVHEACRTRR